MKKDLVNYQNFNNIISDIISHPVVQEMKNFRQHYNCSCYDHCYSVSYYSFLICKKFKLDYKSIARAAMLHDLFLYDWRIKQPGRKGLHAFRHPYVAYKKASALFSLNKKEKDIIIKHMWPVTVIPPKYLESYIITFVDKYCALKEAYNYYTDKIISKKILRYASIFLLMLFIHVP